MALSGNGRRFDLHSHSQRLQHFLWNAKVSDRLTHLVHVVADAVSSSVEVLPVQILVHLAARLAGCRIPGAGSVIFAGDVPQRRAASGRNREVVIS